MLLRSTQHIQRRVTPRTLKFECQKNVSWGERRHPERFAKLSFMRIFVFSLLTSEQQPTDNDIRELTHAQRQISRHSIRRDIFENSLKIYWDAEWASDLRLYVRWLSRVSLIGSRLFDKCRLFLPGERSNRFEHSQRPFIHPRIIQSSFKQAADKRQRAFQMSVST